MAADRLPRWGDYRDDVLRPNLSDVQQCRSWLDRHLVVGPGLTEALTLLAGELAAQRRVRAGRRIDPATLLTSIEAVRGALILPAEQMIEQVVSMSGLPGGLLATQLQALDELLHQLRLSAMSAGLSDGAGELHRQLPGTRASIEEAQPLVRALQLLSMRIMVRLRTRTVVPDVLWQDLGDLGGAMRQSTFLDEAIGTSDDPDGNRTPRTWLILPILLSVACLEERTKAQARLIYRLAAQWADRVGFRIDAVKSRQDNIYGPTVKLGNRYRVRLDTHRLREAMVRRQAKWLNPETDPTRLPQNLSRVQLADLLEDLFVRWSADWHAPRMRPAPEGFIRMRFGMPGKELAAAQHASQQTSKPYEHGQYQREALLAVGPSAPARTELARLVLRGAERGRWALVDRHRIIVDCDDGAVVPLLAGIAVFGLDGAQPADDDAVTLKGLRLGKVRSVQRVGVEREAAGIRRITLDTCGGTPTPVQIQDHSPGLASGAYLLTGHSSSDAIGDTLFTAPARLVTGDRVLLRRPADEISVEVGALIDRGPDFERFAVKARGSSRL